jgi:1-acyl-sn-glycerol-3-phosphate acyltransferase
LLARVYTWVVFIPFFALWTALFGVLTMLVLPFWRRGGEAVPVLWGRGLLWIAFVRVRVAGRERFDPRRQYVIMANHRSHLDAPTVYGWIGLRFLWVMKKELRRAPILGPACARVGHIFIDRQDRAQAIAALERGLARAAGASVVFFPEGTRSPGPDLLPFKKGGFALAAGARLPVLPVTIDGTQRVLSARTLLVHPFKTVRVTFHEAVEPPVVDGPEAREALMEEVRRRIVSALPAPVPAAAPAPVPEPSAAAARIATAR